MGDRLMECPHCGFEAVDFESPTNGLGWHAGCKACSSSVLGLTRENAIHKWNTRATDPLIEILKNEIKRLTMAQDEARLAALADDSVPRLVFKAAIEAIANKDTLLAEMAEALGELDDMFDPTSRVGEIINKALQKFNERNG